MNFSLQKILLYFDRKSIKIKYKRALFVKILLDLAAMYFRNQVAGWEITGYE